MIDIVDVYGVMENLIKDLKNICYSYLTEEEQIYISNEWDKFDKHKIPLIAVENNWLDLLIWAYEQKYDMHYTCGHAAFFGNMEIFKWAIEKCYVKDYWICRFAAVNGHLEILKYAVEKGCKFDALVCNYSHCYKHNHISEWINNSFDSFGNNLCKCGGKYHENKIK